ncbi:carboxylate-amine ligase [Propionicimonas paludicola]|uniref:Putative glutamate--cysteine ligase 2 n=1 Tax=Propionicimonas paludicola TaxID=185243 RepID=A0A2A9CU33_9ACTN|nr:glutamate--cysteine ligase [Propionicimonas paludicola]PFG17934.1 carboxylate-amine ligase [Propionicimonas paludicola]
MPSRSRRSPFSTLPGRASEQRTFGVEEELLVVDATTLRPVPRGEAIVASAETSAAGHRLTTEFKREQVEVVNPPQTTLDGQLAAIRTGRAIADAAAAQHDARTVPLATSPWPLTSTLVDHPRYAEMAGRFALTAVDQLTCGFHVHVGVASDQEGVAALDRIRGWLPVLLALSANSPLWMGMDTGFASYRYQVWSRWPTAGPSELFGSADGYRRHCAELLDTGVPLDEGMLYFDARLSNAFPTIEVRVADVCLQPTHAAGLAAIIRALVETAVREWQAGRAPAAVSAAVLRTWSWQASRFGLTRSLVSPITRSPAPAAEVVGQLLAAIDPVLAEFGEREPVAELIQELLAGGSGAERQREFRASATDTHNRRDLRTVVRRALLEAGGEAADGRLELLS